MSTVLAPVIIALTGLPALAIASWSARDGSTHSRGVGLRWALIGLSMFLGALGLYLTGDHPNLGYVVVIAMVVAVNAIGISLVRHLRRGANGAPGK